MSDKTLYSVRVAKLGHVFCVHQSGCLKAFFPGPYLLRRARYRTIQCSLSCGTLATRSKMAILSASIRKLRNAPDGWEGEGTATPVLRLLAPTSLLRCGKDGGGKGAPGVDGLRYHLILTTRYRNRDRSRPLPTSF